MCLFLNRTVAGSLEVKTTNSVLIIPPLHLCQQMKRCVGTLGLHYSLYFCVYSWLLNWLLGAGVRAAGSFPHLPWFPLLKQRVLALFLAVVPPLLQPGPSLASLLALKPRNCIFSSLVGYNLSSLQRVSSFGLVSSFS